ncbi:Peptidoglycan-binding (PGRP) domain of peptidoglycan hydrolases-containing protein [Amycolatopsis arida]|uniref:Peptidoglycan-binding (PGRP) domain of peptidoglycan hydrolases-containing protein n=1 Tax=Amycolatopsis arida TaxID=587909 RepID=A0A1I5LUM7_9PSEU|nr:penicillin-insensitive murein endopeptidase [Amycolatopsis arida]TDX93856.1 peptidoglycan hydrolase-like protein with peptidoglycan-binding domain [Amycolatopsis arida]SFP01038.1 Peptidoglycan-binding (PGRP) domain of peptidoglycan hydrolases-containing protein [Amycolatopsis arida]
MNALFRLAVAVVVLAGTVLLPGSASAFPGAFFPTQSKGNRGVDVLAVQYLLRHHRQGPPTDGVFGASTDTAVRGFQSAKGLGVDGIVGPNTWGALAVTVRQGDQGDAVRALQVQLNQKNGAGLSVSGSFDAATRTAVTTFQRHGGIAADGIAGPVTWRNLLWHYDYPSMSGICDKDPDNNGRVNWGTGATAGQLEEAVRRFAGAGKGAVPLGDLSKEHGGSLNGHSSHQVGMDVDLWPIRSDGQQCSAGRITWRSSTYDRAATRKLVRDIRASAPGHVKLIFFNDPELIREGLTSEWANHDNHLHVRYCEAVHPNSLYRC